MSDREIRILADLNVEERADGDAAPVIIGYAAIFDTPTDIGGYFREQVRRGAFGPALADSDVHALFNHDESVVLGRKKAGTLRLSEDAKGLRVEIDPPDTQDARDLMAKMKRGDIDQMSFAFSMRGGKEEWDETGELPLRTIVQVGELYDVSIVTRGAYPTTEVGVRCLEEARKDRRQQNFAAASQRIAERKARAEQRFRNIA